VQDALNHDRIASQPVEDNVIAGGITSVSAPQGVPPPANARPFRQDIKPLTQKIEGAVGSRLAAALGENVFQTSSRSACARRVI
jgi:hypothetical protein